MTKDELRETLAALEHDRWCRWEEYRERILNSGARSTDITEASWRIRREQTYSDMTEGEKGPDRAEADKTLAIVWPLIDEVQKIRCTLEAAINTAETYSKQLATAATVAENIGRLWGHVLPKSARDALARMGKS